MRVYTSSAFIRVYVFIHTLHTQKRINHIQTQLSVCIFWYFCSGYVLLLLLYYYMRSHFHSYVSNTTWKLWNTDFHPKICPPFLVVIVNKSLHFYCSQFFTNKIYIFNIYILYIYYIFNYIIFSMLFQLYIYFQLYYILNFSPIKYIYILYICFNIYIYKIYIY